MPSHAIGKFLQGVRQVPAHSNICGESCFLADRLRFINSLDRSIVKTLRTLKQLLTVFAKMLYQIRFRLSGDIANGVNAELGDVIGGFRTNTPQFPDRQATKTRLQYPARSPESHSVDCRCALWLCQSCWRFYSDSQLD